ncbi:MAG: thiamine phosphate synthase [Veillonellaceae bacterium]|nr:thiamine phosphate synthase [Veillonellaceae bacterium]
MENFLAADLYGLTDEPHAMGRSNVETVALLIAAGVKVIQYREKDRTLREQYEECRQIRTLTRQAGVTFIVNDHVDLAMAVHADGVHVGQDDLPTAAIRQLVGGEMIIGLSTHSPQQATAADQSGVVDYIGVGPLFSTQTKRNVCAPVGLEYLDYVGGNIELPFVAIGGIKSNNVAEVRRHGARLIAVVTGIVGETDIPAAVARLRQELRS